ncbi:MAG: ABC transporter ATP-binding protein [Planctomycetota bacterium]
MVTKDTDYVIETFSLTKIFPDWWGRAKVIAIDELDLKIRRNEIYGLLGPNGSGKTTTLKILLSLLRPTKGRAVVLGGDTSDPKISAQIGYLPEESYLYRYLSARETLDFYGRIFGLPPKVRKVRIDALLEMVGLTGMANRAVGTFSKGMARRIGLAQALINDPDLLILDEPTSGMDPISTRQMKDLFIQLAKRGKTILLCSHLLADVENVCDRIGILYGGRMQVEGEVRTLLQHSEEKQILTGPISAEALSQIEQLIRGEESKFEVSSPMDKLEDFFIDTVATAQEQKQPTSGALSTTEIGGFLSEGSESTNILDKLVSASVSDSAGQQSGSAETSETEAATIEDSPDSGLLNKLMKTSDVSEGADVTTNVTEPVELPAQVDEEVKHDVLDKLTGTSEGEGVSSDNNGAGEPGEGEDV